MTAIRKDITYSTRNTPFLYRYRGGNMKNYSTGGTRIQCHPNEKTSAGQHLTDAVLFHTGAPEGAFKMKGARNGTCGEASHLEAKKKSIREN